MLRKERFTVYAGQHVNFLPNGKLACLAGTTRSVVDVNTREMVSDSSGTGADVSAAIVLMPLRRRKYSKVYATALQNILRERT